MKTEEDEAFDELAKRQGMWGGGFPAKRAMAADKLHWSDCAVHNGPAYHAGECDCGAARDADANATIIQYHEATIKRLEKRIEELLAQPAQEPVAWRRREVGGLWQYFGWEETGMTYQSVERWNKNGFECEAIPATPPQEKNNGT